MNTRSGRSAGRSGKTLFKEKPMFTEEENEYMEFLDEVFGVEGIGLLTAKGDPIAFQVGLNEFQREKKET